MAGKFTVQVSNIWGRKISILSFVIIIITGVLIFLFDKKEKDHRKAMPAEQDTISVVKNTIE